MSSSAESPTAGRPSTGGTPRCFLHVPKSAGMSVHAALEAALPAGSVAPQRVDTTIFCDFSDWASLRPETRKSLVVTDDERAALERYPLVSGHFSLPTLASVTPPNRIATVLRDPAERLRSLHRYWRTSDQSQWSPYAPQEAACAPFAEFLRDASVAAATDNALTRLLLAGDPRIPANGFIGAEDAEGLAVDAIASLATLGYVGFQDEPDQLWAGLSKHFGVDLRPVHTNRSGEDGEGGAADATDPAAEESLRARTVIDKRVYDAARARSPRLPPRVPAGVGDQGLRRFWLGRLAQHTADSYAGVRLSKFPEDLRVYEHLLWEMAPDVVIELGTDAGGSALWFRDRLLALQRHGRIHRALVVTVDLQASVARHVTAEAGADHEGILYVDGDLLDPSLPNTVAALLPPGARCMVIEDSAHTYETTLAALRGFARFVAPGGFLVVEDGCVDVEDLRLDADWPRGVLPALETWMSEGGGGEFTPRPDLELYGVTCHPGGFLQRRGKPVAASPPPTVGDPQPTSDAGRESAELRRRRERVEGSLAGRMSVRARRRTGTLLRSKQRSARVVASRLAAVTRAAYRSGGRG